METSQSLAEPSQEAKPVIAAYFTAKAGWRGWFQALSRRQPIYGSGWVEPMGNGLRLYGWRRTWLGIGERAELFIPSGKIRNVAVDGTELRFDIRGLLSLTCSFELTGPAAAEALAGQLPQTKTQLFDRYWHELREFNRKASERTPRPWGTVFLIFLCLVMFAVQVFFGHRAAMFDIQQSVALGALSFQKVQSGEIWRLISSAFLHGDPVHLLVNLWVLFNIGRLTEKLLGSLLFLFVYLSCAALASLGSLIWAPFMVTVGASGAIYGLFGIFLAYLLARRTMVPALLLRGHWLSTLLFVLITLASGFVQVGVANAVHVAGLLSGLALGAVLAWPRLDDAPWPRAAGAALLCALLLAAGWRTCVVFWTPSGEWLRFKDSYTWLVTGEAESLRQWSALEQRISVGKTGGEDAAKAYRTEIAPFWREAEKKLEQASQGAGGELQQLWLIIASYAHSRVALAEADAAYMESPLDTDRSDAAQKALIAINHAVAYMNHRINRGDFLYRPRSLSDMPIFLRLTHLLPGSGGCVRRPEDARFEEHFGTKNDGPSMRREAACRAQQDFLSADFTTLEDRLAHYNEMPADLPDGGSSLNAIPNGLADLFEARSVDSFLYMSRLADWHRQFPNSLWPDLIEAEFLSSTAWTIRGHGFARDVAPQAMQAFTQYMDAAEEILRADMTRAENNRYWYELDVAVQNDLSEDRDAMKEAYKEGSALFPHDQKLHAAMLRAVMPRWGGSVKEVDDLISKAYASTANSDGIQVYAQLYWIYADLEGESVDIFTESGADWDLMRNGFRDMVKKHPGSDVVLNGFARFACVAKDAEEYKRIRPQLDGHDSPTAWPPGLSAAICDKRIEQAQAG